MAQPITYQFEDEAAPVTGGVTYQFEDTPVVPSAPEMPWYQNAAIGVGKGLTDLGTGALQRLLEGGQAIRSGLGMESNQPNIDRLKAITAENRQAFAPLKDQSTAASIGEFIGQAAPTVMIPGGVAGGALRRAGTSALSGAAVGALQPTTGDESVLQNTAVGGVAGAGGSALLSGLGKPVNALMDRLPPNFREALAKKWGVSTTLGEANANPHWQRLETWLERLPLVGLRGFRETQLKEADAAAKAGIGAYIHNPAAVDFMESNRAYASGIFDKLTTTVQGVGKQEISPAQTRAVALQMEDGLSDMFKKFQNTKLERLLKNAISDTKDVSVSVIDDLPGAAGFTPRVMSFKDMWELRDNLGRVIGQAKKKLSGGDVDRSELAEWSKLYGAVNNDIDTWAGSIGRPDIREAIDAANGAYKHYVVKYDKLQDAYDAATRFKDGEKAFNPERFSSELTKVIKGDKEYKSFSPTEIEELNGLAKIMQVVNRSGKYKENLPTGDRWGIFGATGAAGAAAYAAPATGVATAGGTILARVLTGTEAGKKLALAASKMEPSNPNMKVLVNMAYGLIPKMVAVEATRPRQ